MKHKVDRFRYERRAFIYYRIEVLPLKSIYQPVEIDVIAYIIMQAFGYKRYRSIGIGGVVTEHLCQLVSLVNDRRHKYVTQYARYDSDLKQSDKSGYHPTFQMQEPTVEFEYGIKDVGYKTCEAERKKYVFKYVDKSYQPHDQCYRNKYTDYTVKSKRA